MITFYCRLKHKNKKVQFKILVKILLDRPSNELNIHRESDEGFRHFN